MLKEENYQWEDLLIMRITGGKYRGRRVQCPPGIIRPAMDRMRESLFSILGSLEGDSFLDLFSGSGLVGIEAASRGANPVTLVEMDRRKGPVIRKNLEFVDETVRLVLSDAKRYIKGNHGPFSIIYADPPFPLGGKQEFVQTLSQTNLLAPNGLFIIHHPGEERWELEQGRFTEVDKRTYGRSILRFYRYTEELEK